MGQADPKAEKIRRRRARRRHDAAGGRQGPGGTIAQFAADYVDGQQ
ncbi:hypothetical protein GCM10027589_04590 [Actinocorallia lasiicapitis]